MGKLIIAPAIADRLAADLLKSGSLDSSEG